MPVSIVLLVLAVALLLSFVPTLARVFGPIPKQDWEEIEAYLNRRDQTVERLFPLWFGPWTARSGWPHQIGRAYRVQARDEAGAGFRHYLAVVKTSPLGRPALQARSNGVWLATNA